MAKVLVVDDEADIRLLHRVLLESAGHEVTEAIHGAEALEAAKASAPDLIVTDLMMPVMTGDQLITAVRAVPALADVPIVLVSASLGKPAQAGADVVFRKPVAMDQLLRSVVDLTSKSQRAS